MPQPSQMLVRVAAVVCVTTLPLLPVVGLWVLRQLASTALLYLWLCGHGPQAALLRTL